MMNKCRASHVALILVMLGLLALAGCGSPNATTVTIATFFPTSGVDGSLGQALQNAVDLAVSQQSTIGSGYTLGVEHVDALNSDGATVARALANDPTVMGIVGPLDSTAAMGMMPTTAQENLVTISPGATLPGLTLADQATAEKLPFTQLHPKDGAIAFLRLPENDNAMGKVAADLAVAPTSAHGLGANAVFLVDDGSASGMAATAAFAVELKSKGGTVAGQQSALAGNAVNVQSTVSAIVDAYPDAVFYAGGSEAGAELRGTLTLTGASLPLLVVGPGAGDPAFANMASVAAAAANTTAILPAADLSKLPNAKSFTTAYSAAYAGQTPPALAALAYDAAMDEIAAIKSVIASGKAPTRAAVLAAITGKPYAGVTGSVAFDKDGDDTTALGFSLYTTDGKGAWQFVETLKG